MKQRYGQVQLAGAVVCRSEVVHHGKSGLFVGSILRRGESDCLFMQRQGQVILSRGGVGQTEVVHRLQRLEVVGSPLRRKRRPGLHEERYGLVRVTQAVERLAQQPLQPSHGNRIAYRLFIQLVCRLLEPFAQQYPKRLAFRRFVSGVHIREDRAENLVAVLDLSQASLGRLLSQPLRYRRRHRLEPVALGLNQA